MTCVLCPSQRPRPSRVGGVTCEPCIDALARDLGETVSRYGLLDASPSGGISDGGRRAPGFGSRPPGKVHVMALTDDRTSASELGELQSAQAMLRDWANYVAQNRGMAEARRDIEAAGIFLVANLDWITRQEWVVDLHAQLRVVLNQLKSATGDTPLGKCGVCANAIFAPPRGEVVMVCEWCGEQVDPLAQIRMVRDASIST